MSPLDPADPDYIDLDHFDGRGLTRRQRAEEREQRARDFAPGGKYDTSTVTLADRTRCFMTGHIATYGSLYGWCERCKHTVWRHDRRSVLYYGKYHLFPPAHQAREGAAR